MKMGLKSDNKQAKKTGVLKKEVEGSLEDTVEKNMGEKLKKIKEFENKFKERWKFEGDYEFYFSVSFRSGEERDAFLKKNGIKLRNGRYVFYEDLPENIEK